MRLSVIGKIIAGFVVFGLLLFFTNITSYLGLDDIRTSARSVVDEKMPVQSSMLNVQTQILSLGKLSLQGYHASDLASLRLNKQEFDQAASRFEQELEGLNRLLNREDNSLSQGSTAASTYLQNSRDIYATKQAILELKAAVSAQYESISSKADEAGSLLLDLEYIDGAEDNPEIVNLIGSGTSVDNDIIPFLDASKEFINELDAESSAGILADLEYSMSNISSRVDYMNRLAETVDTGGIVADFNTAYQAFMQQYQGEQGLLAQQTKRITLLQQVQSQQAAAESSISTSIQHFSALFDQVNQSTLDGQNEILDVVDSNILKSFLIMGFALVLVGLTGVLAARSIRGPLNSIQDSLQVISHGDLTHKADDSSEDEFGLLAGKVNELSQSLLAVVSQIIAQEKRLESATKETRSYGDDALQQVSEQQNLIIEASDNTEQVLQSSHENLSKINQGMEQLSQVKEQSKRAGDMVEQSRQQIKQQASQAEQSSTIISRLEENSRGIGSILDVIKTIAEQTNLLALNAAIEAARAGEQGRGFAVVADEVRTLATRTQDSTEEIEKVINSLQDDAKQAVDAIQAGTLQAQDSVSLIGRVNEDVNSILSIVNDLVDVNQTIVNDSHSQDQLLNGVCNKLKQIVSLAEQTASITKQSKSAINQVDTLMEELRLAVTKFKVA